jgi:hypothetical protein
MINYNQLDQSNYNTERSYYICLLLGIEEQRVSRQNYDSIRELAMAILSGERKIRLLNELASILMFDVTVGYAEEMITDG